MTWHQWHHTASRSRTTKRFSAAARENRSSPQSFHLTDSAANDEDAAQMANAKARTRWIFMTSPGRLFRQLRRRRNPGSSFPRSHANVRRLDLSDQVDSLA